MPAPARESDGELDLGALFAAVWRRRGWIIAPTLAALLISSVVVNLATPLYRSEARLLIENRDNVFLRPEAERRSVVVDRAAVDQEAITSQVQLLLSRDLARQVVKAQKLADVPEFNPQLHVLSLVSGLLRVVGLGDGPRLSNDERVLRAYFDRLRVYQVDRSRVISIEFESADPELAARVANDIVQNYLSLQQLAKHDSTRQASSWLQTEIENLRKKVSEAENRVEDFRARANLFVGANNTLLNTQQLGELSSQLVLARSQRAEAEAKARAARDMLRNGQGADALDVVSSELVRRLLEQQVTLRAQLAEQSSTLGDQHPRIKQLRAQIARLGNDIREEALRLVRTFDNEARIAGARVETLVAGLEQLKSQAAGSGGQDVQLRALEREAKAQRDLLESYLASYRESTARETLSAPADARVVSRATPSSDPSFPKKLPTVLIATLGTLVLAFGFVATAELVGGQVYRMPPVGRELPIVLDAPALVPQADPAAPPAPVDVAAAVRASDPRVVAFTSARPGLDAGGPAVRLARALCAAGGYVVLVELDPGGRGASLAPGAVGLAELLAGAASLGEVLHRDCDSALHVVPAGSMAMPAGDMLGDARVATALAALAQSYDRVVLALPDSVTVAASPLAGSIDMLHVVAPTDWSPAEAEATYDGLTAAGFGTIVAMAEDTPAEIGTTARGTAPETAPLAA